MIKLFLYQILLILSLLFHKILIYPNKMLGIYLLLPSVFSLSKFPLIKSPHSPPSLHRSQFLSSADFPVYNNDNLVYSTILEIGTPRQKHEFILNTDSPYTWIASKNCNCHKSTTSFDPSLSSSYRNLNEMKRLTYLVGQIVGNFSTETFQVGDLVADKQSFVLAYLDRGLEFINAAGVLGLGFSQLSDGHPTFLETLKAQGQIQNATFSIYLNNVHEEA
jgi:hypothetical protein